jgi:hypothetical protein
MGPAYLDARKTRNEIAALGAKLMGRGSRDLSFVTRAEGRAPQDEEPLQLEKRPSSGRVTKDAVR